MWLADPRLPVQQGKGRRARPRARRGQAAIEKAGRGGKTVSVVYGLPQNAAFLKELCQDLKRTCGTGGAVVDGTVQLQGDLRERIRSVLLEKGIAVKR